MLPIGPCILLWRLHRGLTQAQLARQAGLPRPNLSDIERGRREVSLRTLRSLALALSIRPGILADGIGPQEAGKPLTREELERGADAVASGKPPKDLSRKALVEDLALLVRSRLKGRGPGRRPSSRKASAAWVRLASAHGAPEIQSLVERIAEKADRP